MHTISINSDKAIYPADINWRHVWCMLAQAYDAYNTNARFQWITCCRLNAISFQLSEVLFTLIYVPYFWDLAWNQTTEICLLRACETAQIISIGYLPALVTIISVPSESNSSHNDFISSWAPTPSSLGWSGFSGLTAAVVVWPVPVDPAPSAGVVLPSVVVVSPPRSGSDWDVGDGVFGRCCLSPEPDDSVVLASAAAAIERPVSEWVTPSDDDV